MEAVAQVQELIYLCLKYLIDVYYGFDVLKHDQIIQYPLALL